MSTTTAKSRYGRMKEESGVEVRVHERGTQRKTRGVEPADGVLLLYCAVGQQLVGDWVGYAKE